MRDHPTRLSTSGTLQPQVPFRGGNDEPRQAPFEAGDDSPCHLGKSGTVHCHHYGAFCWKMVRSRVVVCCGFLTTCEREQNDFGKIEKRPFWLSPRQVLVIPVAVPYVSHVHAWMRRSHPLSSLPLLERVRTGDCRYAVCAGVVRGRGQWGRYPSQEDSQR